MKEVAVHNRWKFTFPNHIADWGVWDNWEKARFDSMEQHLHRGNILFDIGASQGDCSAIYSQLVGAENMCLFEPTLPFWVNVRLIWLANRLETPLACYPGFVGDTTVGDDKTTIRSFPECSWQSSGEAPAMAYFKMTPTSDQISIDDWVRKHGIVPDAMTIDVEGAELLILRGAERTLLGRQLVWVSVHPEMLRNDFGSSEDELYRFMGRCGYRAHRLAQDHEVHVLFEPL